MGIIILLMLVGLEIGMMVLRFKTRSNQTEWKNKLRVGVFVGITALVIVQVIQLNFRWYLLYAILLIQAILSVVYLWKLYKGRVAGEKPYKTRSTILMFLRRCMLFIFLITPAILFPQFKSLPVTGEYKVATASYTLEDASRTESYLEEQESRKVTIEFWYPDMNENDKEFPLLIFSHGSFGFRGSNYSTFMELASNGYIVCSIDHTYQSFFTQQTDGKVITVDQNFLNDAVGVQSDIYDSESTFAMTQEWLTMRTADMNFVIETILEEADNAENQDANTDKVYRIIDSNHIGAFGHSLGGATAAQIGRMREDIDAVIVLDGTMIGEVTAIHQGQELLNPSAYPIPILDIFNEEHYKDGLENSSTYANMVVYKNGLDAKQTVFMKSGHLNFTDLPLFSPLLASTLGMGAIDSRYCIETMNEIILSYFNHYLKGIGEFHIQSQY